MPQLRNIYQKLLFTKTAPTTIDGFGLFHDGKINGLVGYMQDRIFRKYTKTEMLDLEAFTLVFDTGTVPTVGYTRTLTAKTVVEAPVEADWATLQSQAGLGNIDLIGRGTIQGKAHGLYYQTSPGNYLADTGATYTQAQIEAFVVAGDTMTVMGVPAGTGSAITEGLPARRQ